MTYYEEENEVVPELGVRIDLEENNHNNKNGEYVKLRQCEQDGPGSPRRCSCGSVWYWVKLGLLLTCLGLLAAVFLKWVGPFFMDKEVIPIINWETTTFSHPILALLVFASVALFPTFLLPSSPSMWVAGMTFGYGFGFLLIMPAVAVGISLPYFIGSLFLHKIQGWLEKYPKKAAILRAAGEGNWFHQFRTVALIRISPFPYIIYNYCAVATRVKYGPYFLGSLVGMVPEIFVTIYTGILIRTLADASQEQHFLSAPQIIFNVLGFCGSVAATIFFTVYAKRQLKVLQKDEELLLQ
ncbi:transmembrane protein 64-like [Pistacia vera]|uniref:transmembrane protein 64-like n=1 Tax=Pistacia vera TaxID=55513 RepID=UPI0012634200|nr:transmembrane protein 64-like [Pistacia vera]